MRNPKTWVIVLSLAAAIYAAFAIWRAWSLFLTGNLELRLLALAIVIIPVLGLVFIIREIQFGVVMQKMGQTLALEGKLPIDDLPRTPSGRVQIDAATARFNELSHLSGSEDWRDWYHIAIAYEDARDRKRARAAMRTAERLFRAMPSADQ